MHTGPILDVKSLSFDTPWVKTWQPEVIGTLVFIVRNNGPEREVLLIHKKTGHGAGKINGPGGKVEPGETPVQCAVREVAEEVGLIVHEVTCRVEMRFVEQNGPQWLGFGFIAQHFGGELQTTLEADPFWCAIDDIPYHQMWQDDQLWLPHLLSSAPNMLVADYLFNDGQLIDHQVSSDPSVLS